MVLHLKPSRIEFCIVSSCHFCALLSLFSIPLDNTLLLLSALLIVGSLFGYCFHESGVAAFSPSGKGVNRIEWHRLFRPRLHVMLGQQHGVLQFGAREVPVSLPCIRYFSEFLIVLSFKPRLAPVASGMTWLWQEKSINVVIWPDSLSRADDRRLRRYLRFDCPQLTG